MKISAGPSVVHSDQHRISNFTFRYTNPKSLKCLIPVLLSIISIYSMKFQPCRKVINVDRKWHLIQHTKTINHQVEVRILERRRRPQTPPPQPHLLRPRTQASSRNTTIVLSSPFPNSTATATTSASNNGTIHPSPDPSMVRSM